MFRKQANLLGYKVEEIDNIYHTSPKMKISDKSVQRLGFVIADKQLKQFKLKDKKKKHYKGVVDGEYLILKKKPFNTRKIGYIKLHFQRKNDFLSYYYILIF